MHKLITIFLLCLIPGNTLRAMENPLQSRSLPSELVKALASGDSETVSAYFHQSLELTIMEKEYMASRNQATRIMQSFFKDNPPSTFKVSFEGTKEKSRYAIGKLRTENGDFRVNLFFMTRDGRDLIYFLSIEKESQYELYP